MCKLISVLQGKEINNHILHTTNCYIETICETLVGKEKNHCHELQFVNMKIFTSVTFLIFQSAQSIVSVIVILVTVKNAKMAIMGLSVKMVSKQ